MYAEFAKTTKEGFDNGKLFEKLANRKRTRRRYRALLANIENDRVFKREENKFGFAPTAVKSL